MASSDDSPSGRLTKLLHLKTGSKDVLRNRENSQLEFKETFNLGSRAKYAKSLAAFANNKGGFIVLGVTNEPHRLKGLNTSKFESCDPARLTEFFNAHFSPELEWEMNSVEYHGCTLGYVYVHEARDKPVVAIANNGSDIHEAAIYYRYRGQSTAIKFPELRSLLDEQLSRERRAWVQHLTTIGRAGPTNVGVIDTVRGKLFGGGPPFLVEESLLRKLKFIRAGRFSETEGDPTLRLVGDIQPVAGIVAEKSVHVGIHAEDLFTSFLAQRPLEADQAAAYLRETAFQSSPFLPVHYLFRASGLTEDQVRAMFKECTNAPAGTKSRLLQRLFGTLKVPVMGALGTVPSFAADITPEQILHQMATATTPRTQRALLLSALKRDPRLIDVLSPSVSPARYSEAVTHLAKEELLHHKSVVLEQLLLLFEQRFAALEPAEKTYFRKAVARCDDLLFSN